jgi:hypothetical protein
MKEETMTPTACAITRTAITAALLALSIAVTPTRSSATVDGLDLIPPAPLAGTMPAATVPGSNAFWRTGEVVMASLPAHEV